MFFPCSFDITFTTKKYLEQNTREIADHLRQEISKVTKYMLNSGASENAELTCSHYRLSPLVLGELQIRCKTA